MLTCPVCKKKFVQTVPWKRHCSKPCTDRASQLKRLRLMNAGKKALKILGTLTVLWSVLSVPSAWADEKVIQGATSCANYFTVPTGGCLKPWGRWLYTDQILGPQIITQEQACLAQMETAMRAMDKYLNWFRPSEKRAYKNDEVWISRFDKDYELIWAPTKRDCWKKTP